MTVWQMSHRPCFSTTQNGQWKENRILREHHQVNFEERTNTKLKCTINNHVLPFTMYHMPWSVLVFVHLEDDNALLLDPDSKQSKQ